MKKIELGTCFSVPFDDGSFAFGYVIHDGKFLLVNIFDFKSNNEGDILLALKSPYLVKDWLIDAVVFSSTGRRLYKKWKLHRKIIFDSPVTPSEPFVVFGDDNNYKLLNYLTEEVRPASDNDVGKYQKFITWHSSYYTAFLIYKFQGVRFKDLEYDFDLGRYVPV